MLITANNADTQATVTFTGTASIANVKGNGASKTDIAIDFIGAPTLTLGCRCSQFIIWQSN
ncbi:hypothetical protein MNB_SUP05-SYMBIONT-5-418 [hydrothermal vent metagenome]|uniref:Uncharacterized protein n=1 Tax=hydrothermal vent metagenome TaxID=652676 RepID=A0A1W1E757_9ZZZZ